MPSVEAPPEVAPERTDSASRMGDGARRALALLRSQGLGVFCGLGTAALLAIGSFVLALGDGGASPFARMDDVRAFFERPRLHDAWFFALCALLGLYALNTLLATLDTVVRRIRARVRAPSAYAASFLHLAFVVALAAHGVDGLWHEERGRVVLGSSFTALPGGPEARVVSVESERLPSGMPKRVAAKLELREGGGALSTVVVGYNEPLTLDLGREVWLFAAEGRAPGGRFLARAGDRCEVSPRGPCALGPYAVELVSTMGAARRGAPTIGRLRVRLAAGAREIGIEKAKSVTPPVGMVAGPEKDDVLLDRWLGAGRALPLPDGSSVVLTEEEGAPRVALEGRRKPGHPFALASALMMLIGLGAMVRRFGPRG